MRFGSLSSLQQLLEVSAFCPCTVYTLKDAYATRVICIVNDAVVHDVPNVQQTLLQFFVNLRLMHLLLNVAPSCN